MTKKKLVSPIELFLWKFTGFLFLVAWVIAIIFTAMLIGQYGTFGAGFIFFFIFLVLVPVSYLALCISIVRLRPHGFKYGMAMLTVVIGALPCTFFVASFVSTVVRVDPMAAFVTVGLAVVLIVFALFRKTARYS